MPSLLFLTQRLPFPATKGEKIRHLHILQHLRRSYDIYLGCLVDDPLDLGHVPGVRALCQDACIALLNRRQAKIACLRGLLTGAPLSVIFYQNRTLSRWVRQVLRDVQPEAVVVCSSNMAPYVLDAPLPARSTVIADLADVDSEKWRAYAEEGAFPMRLVHAREWRRMAALEARIARECDWATFVSDQEAALFNRLQPGRADKVRAVSNGVDHVFFDPALPCPSPFAPGLIDFVFTGTMDYPPNIDAVRWFARSMLPLIRRTIPAARFHIVGANPTPAVRELALAEAVHVTGRVADTRPFLAHAAACVAPMRIARGIQNKVLEAMAMSRPVVATTDALEGIAAIPGKDVLVADTPEAFAAACVAASGPAGRPVGEAARRRVIADYTWSERLRGFDALLRPSLVGKNGPVRP